MSFGDRDTTAADVDSFSLSTDELDVVESQRPPRRKPGHHRIGPPHVILGTLIDGGLAPAIMAIVERGVRRRPAAARALNAEVELKLEAPYPPVRILFGHGRVLVEDGGSVAPDLRVTATLADLVHMMVTPLLGGMPSPVHARGRATLGMVAFGRIRFEGRLGLIRRLLTVIRV
jgi:hypothetical protein